MMRCLVTGGAGFIGSNIVEELVARGNRVRVLDNFSTGKRENLWGFAGKIELMEGDIRNIEDCRKAVEGAEVVFHQAAIPSVPRSVSDPLMTNEANLTGTLNLLVAARDAKTRRVVFASSSAVYGDLPGLPKTEDMPLNPLSPYALHKLASEHYLAIFHRLYGLETVSLRYFNVFGPRQDPKSEYAAVIPKFINMMLQSKNPTIFGDGKQTRDFTYISDVVQGNLLAFSPALPGEVRHSQADISHAISVPGFKPRVSFREGLRKTIEWYKTNKFV